MAEPRAGKVRRSGGCWYGSLLSSDCAKGKAQVELRLARAAGNSIELPEPVLRLAQDEYDIQFPGQPYERMQERGGLSLLEIIGLLADALERERR
jgi:hypothetical protein